MIFKKILYIKYLNILNYFILNLSFKFYNISFILNKNKIFLSTKIIKFNSIFAFEILIESTSLDFIQKKKRFFLKYFLLSIFYNLRLVLTILLEEFSFISSLQYLYYSAICIEREIWDMFGIFFLGNWNLKRILTDYGFLGKPLRKDFPIIGYLELIFDDSNKTIKFESIQLLQKYRNFEFKNFW